MYIYIYIGIYLKPSEIYVVTLEFESVCLEIKLII